MGVVDVRVPGRQAAQPHPHIGGRRHKPGDPGVGLRPFALPPKDFRPVVHRHLPAGQADHRLLCRLLHGADIRRAAGIQPGVVRRNRHPISADTKNPRHLGVHPHRGDLIRGYSALFQHGADGAADAAQHLLWILRDGAGLRMEQDGRLEAVGQQGPVRRVYGRFSALGANVATDETGSHMPRLLKKNHVFQAVRRRRVVQRLADGGQGEGAGNERLHVQHAAGNKAQGLAELGKAGPRGARYL